MSGQIRIGDRAIGALAPTYVIAELSGNHNGSLDLALATVRAAKQAGADAIKLQTYTADTMTIDSDREWFVVPDGGPWGGRRLYDLYQEAHTPWEWHRQLFKEARGLGLDIFSTPFDSSAVDFLEDLGVPAYKIASFELGDDALLSKVAGTGKPVILSTGMASLEEIAHAVSVLRGAGCDDFVLLRCTSAYPAPDESMNLSTLPVLAATFACPVGLSDHSMGTTAPIVAVSLGACVIEKHFTLSRADGGVDSHFSLEPDELSRLVRGVRRAELMIGVPSFGTGLSEESSVVFRRSLFIVEELGAGERITERHVRSMRPGHGLPPRYYEDVIGMRVGRDVARGTPLTWDLLKE